MFTSRLNQNAPPVRAPFARVNGQLAASSQASQQHKSSSARKSGRENRPPAPAQGAARARSPSFDAETEFVKAQAQYRETVEKQGKQDARLRVIGRIIARFFSPFDDVGELLHLAITSRTTPRPRLNAAQRKQADLGGRILDAFPDLGDLINELTLSHVGDKITKARNLARAFDTFKLRRAVMHWSDWDIEASAYNDKTVRGWSNEYMAWLILPPSMDCSPEQLQKLKAKKDFVFERELPRLCFEGGDPSKASGFMRHPSTLRGGIVLMRGFAAGLDGRGAPGNTARRYGLNTITYEFVGYVVAQCRYAFSDETSFTPDGTQGFNYRELYDAVLQELKKCHAAGRDGAGARAIDDLMAYWNEYVFTAQGGSTRADEEDDRAVRAEEFSNEFAERWGMDAEQDESASQSGGGQSPRDDMPRSDDTFPAFQPAFEPEEGNYEAPDDDFDDGRSVRSASEHATYPETAFSTQLDDGNGYAQIPTGMVSSSPSSSSLSPPPFPSAPAPAPAKTAVKRKKNPRARGLLPVFLIRHFAYLAISCCSSPVFTTSLMRTVSLF
ncbi:hypothetical protein EXIGLDRAFT_696197 [Exidia glandulosa HHB12029]|uniref:Uncharacterized protein n=1 Tax=Exidia glandulosa HHB12029 TaxID=1314781 RepID=A0A165FHJ4_EXIGL|nr:hypothetical protein EXIGLDRAFT_696197 [Exidia glandulosa HHB12029]